MTHEDALWSLLAPRSVAVVGASVRQGSMAAAPVANLQRHGYAGSIWPVSRRHDEICGICAYSSLSALPAVPDTAVLVVPASQTLAALEECEELGVPSATVVAAGFGEGAAGSAGQLKLGPLEEFLSRARIRVLGPNTAGLFNLVDDYVPRAALNHPVQLAVGGTAVVTQSGGLCNLLVCRANLARVGVCYAVACGNQSDVRVSEMLKLLLGADHVQRIIVATEAPLDRAEIVGCGLAAVQAGKPLIWVAMGRSATGKALAATHSGALSTDSQGEIACLQDFGVVCITSIDDAIDIALALDRWNLSGREWPRRFSGHNVGIVSTTGGDAIIAVDTASDAGLEVPDVKGDAASALNDHFAFAHVANPLDLTAEVLERPDLVAQAIRVFLEDGAINATAFISGLGGSEYGRRLYPVLEGTFAAASAECKLALVVARRLGTEDEQTDALLRSFPCPVFDTPERAMWVLRRLDDAATVLRKVRDDPMRPADYPGGTTAGTRGRATSAPAAEPDVSVLPYWASRQFMQRECPLPLSDAVFVTSLDDAFMPPESDTGTWAVKASARSIIHKAAAAYVQLDLRNDHDIRAAVSRFLSQLWPTHPPDDGEGIVVERQFAVKHELFLGGYRDPHLGPMIIFGLGGSDVELYRETAVTMCPLTHSGLHRLTHSGLVGKLLARDRWVKERVSETLQVLGGWFSSASEVAAFDINPMAITRTGELVCLDVRVETFTAGDTSSVTPTGTLGAGRVAEDSHTAS